ncbi:hypothetical protein PR202_gb20289 [Eleusine coracana subsp. coracana]|uniref:Uncharacterized protein n=1 Tax=Eleusine coracana subsp. coracana TaxID=191504 RepID=A0AAV5FBW7_ELECO|nr:hypothetical protein PR202_gb20289 [Eleusine coracana subsp. coracana]
MDAHGKEMQGMEAMDARGSVQPHSSMTHASRLPIWMRLGFCTLVERSMPSASVALNEARVTLLAHPCKARVPHLTLLPCGLGYHRRRQWPALHACLSSLNPRRLPSLPACLASACRASPCLLRVHRRVDLLGGRRQGWREEMADMWGQE